jgi:Ni/Co efflux regulator RcnB
MNTRIFNITLVVLSLGLGSMAPAQAQPEHGAAQGDERGNDRGDRGHRTDRGHPEQQRDSTRNQRYVQQYRGDHYPYADQGSGASGRNWRRGERLPMQYRSHQYVVEDWRGHHLYAPPRGQYWVQSGGDYFLVVIATGVIASILLSN